MEVLKREVGVCDDCGWALDLGGVCTNPSCEHGNPSVTPAGRDLAEPSKQSKEAAFEEARKADLKTYNRRERRGNATGRRRKITPTRQPPPPMVPDERSREEREAARLVAAERELRHRAKVRKRRSAARAARRRSR